jgi:CBS domain-containing protein
MSDIEQTPPSPAAYPRRMSGRVSVAVKETARRAWEWVRSHRRRLTQWTAGAATLFGTGLLCFGVFRFLADDAVTALACAVVGWFLRDAATAAYDRSTLYDALRGLAVRDAMLTEVATIPAQLTVSELASEHFLRGGYDSYPVVRGDRVVGLLSVRTVMALSAFERERTSVQAVMAPLAEAIVVAPGEPLRGVIGRMARSGMRRLLVVEDGQLQGLLSLSSVFRHMRMREALAS